MKKLALSFALLLGVASWTSAQDNEAYNIASLGFNNIHVSPSHGENTDLSGLFLNYTHGFPLTQNHPMSIEVGGRLAFGWASEEISSIDSSYNSETKTKMGYIAVPVNYAYHFTFGDFGVTPYTGFNLKLNLYGKQNTKEYDGTTLISEQDINFFKKYELPGGLKSDTASRVQFGWQIGARGQWRSFLVGLEYEIDFNDYMEKVSTSNFFITLGYQLPF